MSRTNKKITSTSGPVVTGGSRVMPGERIAVELGRQVITSSSMSTANSDVHREEKLIHIMEDYKPLYKTPMEKLATIKQGLKPGAIRDLMEVTGVTQMGIAHLLSLAEPTLRKYINEGKHLNVGVSEHVLQLFELFDKGMETFGTLDEFKLWLSRDSVGLNAKPIELIDTITGINIVMTELLRIDYGITA